MIWLAALLLIGAAQQGGCLELLADRQAGEPVAATDVRASACPEKGGPALLRYDRALGANVAAVALKSGDIIASAHLGRALPVRQGERLTLASRAGSVIIERPVTALQTARPGDGRIFVRTDDGEILSAPIELGVAK